MALRTAYAQWTGDFQTGSGTINFANDTISADYSYASIFKNASGTSPIEMLGASLAGCFTGALAAILTKNGNAPRQINTKAEVHVNPIEKGFTIAKIHLHTQVEASGINEAALTECAERIKCSCPVGQALGTVEISVKAELA